MQGGFKLYWGIFVDYRQIETFLQVVRDLNMSKAADHLFITQSTVSYRIKHLEEELGTELVERKKGSASVRITEAGKIFIPIAEEWLSVNEKIEDFCKRQNTIKLRIAAPDSIHYMYREIYKKIRESEKAVKISLLTANSDQIVPMLRAGMADLGFGFIESHDKDIVCDVEEQFPMVAFVRTNDDDLFSGNINELDPLRMIQITGVGQDNPATSDLFRSLFGEAPEPTAQYDSLASIINNADIGEWGLIPDTGIDRERHGKDIEIIDIDNGEHKLDLYRMELNSLGSRLEKVINRYF